MTEEFQFPDQKELKRMTRAQFELFIRAYIQFVDPDEDVIKCLTLWGAGWTLHQADVKIVGSSEPGRWLNLWWRQPFSAWASPTKAAYERLCRIKAGLDPDGNMTRPISWASAIGRPAPKPKPAQTKK